MSDLLKCVLVACVIGTLSGCSGESPSPRPANNSQQAPDSAKQGSDTNQEDKPSSGSDHR